VFIRRNRAAAPAFVEGVIVVMVRRRIAGVLLGGLFLAMPVDAATVRGSVSDATGGSLPGARVVLRGLATGQERSVETTGDGQFLFDVTALGTYLIIVTRDGFSGVARTLTIGDAGATFDLPVQLEVGGLNAEVTVTATRAERETRQIPLHVETIPRAAIEQANTLSAGDALAVAANVTPVGNGPFGVRPRLRGLDSTRLLVLVDGERLNTARQATDRTGAEVGLISPDAVARMEIINGAGTLLYGSDALAGTINIITNEPSFSTDTRWIYGFNGFYSTNERGERGTATVGVTAPSYAIRLQAGAESFDNYTAGALTVEDTRPFVASGQLRRTDTIDTSFGLGLAAFPDPFNAPYVRTDNEIQNSGARGRFLNMSSLVRVGERRTVRLRYQRRQMDDVGFPDFVQPSFFNVTSLPKSDLDRVSVRYEAQALTRWLANLSLTAHYQRTQRLLQNLLPVQFPAPTPVSFFPISVFRLGILSETEQRVWTPGIDLQAVLVPVAKHVLTTGLTFYRDRSSDTRTTTTTTSMIGQAVLGPRGPSAIVFPSPVQLGPPSVAHPVRVPDASLRDIAAFAQDEWTIRPGLSLVAGLRGDFYNVTTEATPGYDVTSVVAGARPAIDPSTLPDPNGATYTRHALTGDIGLVANADSRVSPFVRFGRSYRHPNLEEMLYAGPATAGSIAPNVKVAPETGNNVDAGAKFRLSHVSGGAYVFVNQYENFVAQDLAVAATAAGPMAQATNYADVRISGLEVSANSPFSLTRGVLTLGGSGAFTRGTITSGVNPLNGSALDGEPADNITPVKMLASARFAAYSGRWWVEYGVRTQAKVSRVTPTLLTSPFAIAQDLLSLDGFTVQRLGWGVNLTRRREKLGLTFAVENLANRYYREHFQFAPSRGRTFTVGVSAGAF
jgi:outer membrane receptor protein involved in Fe transport